MQITTYDAQSSAGGARNAMGKLLELDPMAVLGPALSDAARGALTVARGNRALLLGGGATDLIGAAHPCTFRAQPGDAVLMARLAGWLRDETHARRVAILWSAQEPYRNRHDALLKAARTAGLDPVDAATGADPLADLSRLLHPQPDALVLLVAPEIAGRALIEARRQSASLPLLGGESLLDARTLERAGPAAEGVRVQTLLADDPAAPELRAFMSRFLLRTKEAPSELAMAGYVALGAVAAAADRAGSTDPRAVCDALRGLSLSAAQAPMLLLDSTWNDVGEMQRMSWMVEIRNGRAVVVREVQ